ncbi:MAG: hypothetical protein OXE78_07575, partial [Gammaproteobacteria bacterium]|nr:hypothetical protein [Gammaproteobacteria bacterium]
MATIKQDEREVLFEAKGKGFHIFSNGQMGVFLSVAAILISMILWGGVSSINTRIYNFNTRIDGLSLEVRTLRDEVVDVSMRVACIEGHLGLTTEVASVEYTDPKDA